MYVITGEVVKIIQQFCLSWKVLTILACSYTGMICYLTICDSSLAIKVLLTITAIPFKSELALDAVAVVFGILSVADSLM